MKTYSLSDPLVREAIYYGYRGICFYTGRPVPKEIMEIDHLIPVAQGGPDTIDNFVLTCSDINNSKQDRTDSSMIERMQYIVRVAYVPRVFRKLQELKRSRPKGRRPINLRCVGWTNLFWVGDKGIKILTNSPLVTKDNFTQIIEILKRYLNNARERSSTSWEVWFTNEFANQIRSLWYETDNSLIKLVNKTILYDRNTYYELGVIHFNPKYIAFLEQLDAEQEQFSDICDSDDEAMYNNYMTELYEKYPQPEVICWKKYFPNEDQSTIINKQDPLQSIGA